MISYLGSLVQFSPAAGRVGRCRQISLCVGSTRRVPPRQPEVFVASPRVRRAFSLRGEQPRQPVVLAASPRVLRAFSLKKISRFLKNLVSLRSFQSPLLPLSKAYSPFKSELLAHVSVKNYLILSTSISFQSQ